MNKKLFILILIFLTLTTALFFSQERVAKIFFVNLFNEKVDIRLGESDYPVFTMNGLDPFSSTYILNTDKIGKHKLYFKKSVENDYYYWSDDGETPNYCNIESGRSYCIFITTNGQINYFFLKDDLKSGAKVCFINGADSQLSKMQISKDWEKNIAAYTENINTNAITNFVTFLPGIYSLYWQFPNQKEINKYFYLTKDSGNSKLVYAFRDNNYYIFLAYSKARTDYAKLLIITPK